MALVSIPYTFTNGTTADATQVNANFTAIFGAVNGNLDSANISSLNAAKINAGSFASGAYSFPGSLSIGTPLPVTSGGTGTATPGLVAGTNVTITGTWPNQTINASESGSVPASDVTAGTFGAGNFVFPNNLTVDGTTTINGYVDTTTNQNIGGDKTFTGTTTTVEGNLEVDGNAIVNGLVGASGTYVPPMFTPTGGSAGTTAKLVTGSGSITTDGSGLASLVVILSGNAEFFGTYAVAVSFSGESATQSLTPFYRVVTSSGTGFTIYFSGGGTSTSFNVQWTASGT